MLKLLVAILIASGLAGQATAHDYAVGQVWEYRARAGDEGSLLRIQQIEVMPEDPTHEPIYHISVVGVRLAGQQTATDIGHLPVSRASLDASVTRLTDASVEFPDAAEGVAQWRQAQGGVFTIPMDQIVDFADRSMRQAMSQSPGGKTVE